MADPVLLCSHAQPEAAGVGGLGGVRRLMDEFAIESGPAGTRIVACKWLDRPS